MKKQRDLGELWCDAFLTKAEAKIIAVGLGVIAIVVTILGLLGIIE